MNKKMTHLTFAMNFIWHLLDTLAILSAKKHYLSTDPTFSKNKSFKVYGGSLEGRYTDDMFRFSVPLGTSPLSPCRQKSDAMTLSSLQNGTNRGGKNNPSLYQYYLKPTLIHCSSTQQTFIKYNM